MIIQAEVGQNYFTKMMKSGTRSNNFSFKVCWSKRLGKCIYFYVGYFQKKGDKIQAENKCDNICN